jgi:hypothetical protein
MDGPLGESKGREVNFFVPPFLCFLYGTQSTEGEWAKAKKKVGAKARLNWTKSWIEGQKGKKMNAHSHFGASRKE